MPPRLHRLQTVHMLSSFVAEAQEILADRLERPDTSIGADEQKIKIVTDKKDAEERGS